jgi:hypothetical protein
MTCDTHFKNENQKLILRNPIFHKFELKILKQRVFCY